MSRRKPVPGICDVCGFTYPLNTMRKNDRGSMACTECWEPEHPQKYLHSKGGDPAPVLNARDDPFNHEDPQYSCPGITISATGGTATFTVTKTARTDLATTIYWGVRGGTAAPGGDYQASPLTGVLSFAIGETVKTIPITVFNIAPLARPRSIVIELSEIPSLLFSFLRTQCWINP